MKTRRYDGSELRRVLTAMITDMKVCSRIATQWSAEGLFDAKWANTIGRMVVGYYHQYGRNPGDQIEAVFETWINSNNVDDKTAEHAENFMRGLSDSYEPEASDYILDIAKRYFDKVKVEKTIAEMKMEVENDRIEDALAKLNIGRTNLGEGSYLEASSDPGAWAALSQHERSRPLFRYRGALGSFIGDSFTRGSLYAFMAVDKAGKTTYIVDAAARAARARNRVAYFEAGDGDEDEVLVRLACRVTGRPEFEEVIHLPVEWEEDLPKLMEMKLDGVDFLEGYRKFRKTCKSDDAFRISSHSNSSLAVSDIDGILEDWEKSKGWVPDVVLVDYADILAPPKGVRDSLDQIDETWKQLRRLSQKRNCLVLTATQAAASAYKESYLLSKADFSGRKTKLAHVNGMIGINVSPKEKDLGMGRINWIVRRKGKSNEKAFVRVAGSMAIGNPAILSRR